MSPQTTTPTLHEIHADDVREHTPLPHDVSTQAIPVVIPEGAAPVVTVHGPVDGRQAEILTDEALAFLGRLHRLAEDRRRRLLEEREYTRRRITDGWNPHYLRSTRRVREDDSWRVAPLAPGLQDRRVEITGPVDRKMTINALNSGASGWLADFEDSSTPSWDRMLDGQVNLFDAIRDQIDFTSPEGKEYRLRERELTDRPTIIVRPRGWHLDEKHVLVDGQPLRARVARKPGARRHVHEHRRLGEIAPVLEKGAEQRLVHGVEAAPVAGERGGFVGQAAARLHRGQAQHHAARRGHGMNRLAPDAVQVLAVRVQRGHRVRAQLEGPPADRHGVAE